MRVVWIALLVLSPVVAAGAPREDQATYAVAPVVPVSDCDGFGVFSGLTGVQGPVRFAHACSSILPGESMANVRIEDVSGRPVSFLFGFRGVEVTRHVHCGAVEASREIPDGATSVWIAFDIPGVNICPIDRAATAGTVRFTFA